MSNKFGEISLLKDNVTDKTGDRSNRKFIVSASAAVYYIINKKILQPLLR